MGAITRREAIKRGSRIVLGAAAGTLFHNSMTGCSAGEPEGKGISGVEKAVAKADIADIELTVLYDNIRHDTRLRQDWGFSCLVKGLDKTIVFDSGRYDDIFMSNLSMMKVDPRKIDLLFLSHEHPDHIGGAKKILQSGGRPEVFLPGSFSSGFKRSLRNLGATVAEVDPPAPVTENCFTTGEMSNFMKNEQALAIATNRGTIILTGCAHPGVAEIVERVMMITGDEVLLVAGGFHLLSDYDSGIRKIAARFEEMGVRHVAPSHCSGGEALEVFAEAYGKRFIKSGLGRVITAADLVAV